MKQDFFRDHAQEAFTAKMLEFSELDKNEVVRKKVDFRNPGQLEFTAQMTGRTVEELEEEENQKNGFFNSGSQQEFSARIVNSYRQRQREELEFRKKCEEEQAGTGNARLDGRNEFLDALEMYPQQYPKFTKKSE